MINVKSLKSLLSNHMVRAVFMLAAILIVLSSPGGCKKKAPPQGGEVEVTAMKIVPADTPVVAEFVAQTQSSHEVEIRARVNGFLEKRVYTEGTVVKKGSVLFVMDKKPFQAQLDSAVAALARQKSAHEVARMNLERVKPLAEQNALSQKDLDDAKGSYESTAAAVEQAKAQLEMARLNLSYCTITSPINGITSSALVQDGAYVSQVNNQLTTVSVLSPMWVNFSISENDMKRYGDKIASGQIVPPKNDDYEVEIVLVDGSIFSEKGRITFAAPSYNAKTGTFLIRSSVKNEKGVLRPNQYVRARLKGAVRRNAILVPQRAVQQGAKGHFMWVITPDGKAEFRPVTVGDWFGNDVFIDSGLRPGEQVVVDGTLRIRQGEPVKIRSSAGAAPPAAGEKPSGADSASGDKPAATPPAADTKPAGPDKTESSKTTATPPTPAAKPTVSDKATGGKAPVTPPAPAAKPGQPGKPGSDKQGR
ncbi:MAG TPA: efflux RND transporter periplasmic adaptor subunit [Syntrophorhabdaceae bacterium]|nr:efflux RND transporter periplasmic adaptor subunit [Syntrophorhabdaceae bacterium]